MSRVGKNPVEVPGGVEVTIDGGTVSAKGKLGLLSMSFTDDVEITKDGNQVTVTPRSNVMRARKMWGTARAQIENLVQGVSEGFTKKLVINGVGYRAQVKGKDLVLALGYSHDVIYPIAEGLTVKCPDQTHIEISGANKQLVGQTAAEIRAFRPPEPYKGKGIKYEDEYILRKEGKKK
ncbi:50S ribosomal protein L6 [Magnetospira sp. QH-2]|uniref:50S ribosomal protein L6 n=1 Tax=Magnetospira sp. (strain QH-2) TaxID=1288970 RepID=UPI0003E81641|nr:50S ribosomal protein L6 [Magnetospira sp. QH-2]CCQ74591.1 50S ribosomal subunit protein L6 [Magnetospira sp. QH-2]